MEVKKTTKADLEYDRTTFFLLGFVVALSTLFVAFEWETETPLSPDWAGFPALFIEEETVGVQEQETPVESKTPEPVEVPVIQPVASDEFNVVEEVVADELPPEAEEPEIKDIAPAVLEALKNEIHTEADIMPQFKGGYAELVRFIYNHLEYPSLALKQRIQGRVWCSFIVNQDGSVSDIQLEKGVYFSLDDEALRVLSLMPAWDFAVTAGKPVRVKVYLPIVFKL